jgi:hypothetical protein
MTARRGTKREEGHRNTDTDNIALENKEETGERVMER